MTADVRSLMPWFRACRSNPEVVACRSLIHSDQVRTIVAESFRPAHFFAAKTLSLEWEYVAREEIPWEVFQGRLLDRSQTRLRRSFEAWKVFATGPEGRSGEPILSLQLDLPAGQLHITRSIHCYAWEGYHAGGNVYLSRETKKWVRDLVATINLARFHHVLELRDELMCCLFQAVVGVSRLPLTSLEAPLPAFSLGELAYIHGPVDDQETAGVMGSYHDLIRRGLHGELSWLEKAKLLEILLRSLAAGELEEAADLFIARWRELGETPRSLLVLLRTLFNEAALSPWTDFVDRSLAFVQQLAARGHVLAEEHVDFLSYLLRQLGRHLTAYDLITFHHRGANYPDALLLDAALKAYSRLAESHSALFLPAAGDNNRARMQKRIRRRALRQGWLLRRFYEGLPVPEAPTSPGENARILPPSHVRVPDEQILMPAKRTKRLFEDDPLAGHLGDYGRHLLHRSVQDLEHALELRELGTALFLDRPLGAHKAAGEPDQTLLFSYEAFSRSTAKHRLQYLDEQLGLITDRSEYDRLVTALEELQVKGLVLDQIGPVTRSEIVSLEDARKAAEDFLLLRTTRRSVEDFLACFDFGALGKRFSLDYLAPGEKVLIVRQAEARLLIYDDEWRRRLELQVNPRPGYETRAGLEYPAGGLQVLRAWEVTGGEGEYDLRSENLLIAPR